MTDTTARQEILRKIAQLSKFKSTDSGAFQGEVSNAAGLIQKLMDKYSISQGEVEETIAQNETKAVEEVFKSKASDYVVHGLVKWHWDLAGAIARITHTKNYFGIYKRTGVAKFFGAEGNVEVATNLFAEWVQIIESMAISATDDYWKVVMKKYDYAGFLARKKENGWGREMKFMDEVPFSERTTYYKQSWLDGCLTAILTSILKQERERTKDMSNAIVLYNDKMLIKYDEFAALEKMRPAKIARVKVYSDQGYRDGHETGSKIKIGSSRIGG